MSIASIRQGQMSAREKDGGVYDARLAAFQEKHVKPEFIDNSKQFMDAINADKIKGENFTEAAFSTKIAPSTANMYESHFQLAKDKFDILYDDKTLEHFSKDEQGMRKWQGLVQQLNQEISMYEQIYEDSYGDPSSADGTKFTWSDYQARIKGFGGDEEGWFNANGLSSVNPNSAIETMKKIDSKQHSNLTFDFDTGTFNYDTNEGVDKNFLEPKDPNLAANIFAFESQKAVFKDAVDYSEQMFPIIKSYSEEAARDRLLNLESSDEFINSAITSFQNSLDDDDPVKNLHPQDYRKNLEPGALNDIVDQFKEEVIDLSEQKKKKEDAKKEEEEKPINPNLNNQPFKIINEIPDEFYKKSEVEEGSDVVRVGFSNPVYIEGVSQKATEVYYADGKFYSYYPHSGGIYMEIEGTDVDVLLKDQLNTNIEISEFVKGDTSSASGDQAP